MTLAMGASPGKRQSRRQPSAVRRRRAANQPHTTGVDIRTESIKISLRLQAAFGLRREESIKIVPMWADRGHSLVLKDSWIKGGRQREIPIRSLEQRQLVDEAKALAKGKSLVAPGYTTYRDYLQHFRAEC